MHFHSSLVGRRELNTQKTPLQASMLIQMLTIAIGAFTLLGCSGPEVRPDRFTWELAEERLKSGIFQQVNTPPEYIVLEGYPSEHVQAISSGIDVAREYFGNFGPVRVYILGKTDGAEGTSEAYQNFVEEYCRLRTEWAPSGFEEDCFGDSAQRLVDVAKSGGQEAFQSMVIYTEPPYSELIFINADDWGETDMPLRGIHEYTHVFQCVFPESPGWLMEGGAVFFEAWLGSKNGWVDFRTAMHRSLWSAQQGRDRGKGLSDMEYTRDLPEEMIPFHRSIAYDMGVWAVTFMISRSNDGSVSDFRDQFYPLVKTEGWQRAVSIYAGTVDIDEFYRLFEEFLGQPLKEQLDLLKTLKDGSR